MSTLYTRLTQGAKLAFGVTLLVTLCLVAVVAVPQLAGGDESFVVTSDSMSPALDGGDVVIVSEREPDQIEEGDVITFAPPGDIDQRTTHRVVEVDKEGGQTAFITQGDANDSPDGQPVAADRVIGEVTLTIPYFGRFVMFAQSQLGIVTLIILPGLALVGTEVLAFTRQRQSEQDGGAENDGSGSTDGGKDGGDGQ